MTSPLSRAILLVPAILLSVLSATGSTKNDVVIDNEERVFTIIEKGGRIASVKSECNSWYLAPDHDAYADAITSYNDNVSIDKASAPGAKPYYRSWNSPDVFFDGVKVCYMNVPLKKGKPAKVSFVQTYRRPEHFCKIIIPSHSYEKRHSTTSVKVPPALASRIKVTPFKFTDNITMSSATAPDGSVTYTVEANNLKPWTYQTSAPSVSVSAPQIIITGQFADTSELYRHFRTFIDDEDIATPELTDLAAQIRNKAVSPPAIIDSTAAWVRHNIRCLAVEHGEYAFRPARAADVLKSRAGDCKGSANLIKALLKANGLDGRLAWIGTDGDIPFDWDEVPALCSGNHVIAACVLPDSIVFLDGTTTWASPGYIPPSIRNRRVMVENGGECIVTNVPDHGRNADREEITTRYSIAGNDLTGKTDIKLTGVHKMSFLSALASREPRDRQKLINRILTYPHNGSKTDSTSVDADLSRQEVAISGNVSDINAAQTIGDKIYIDLKLLRDAYFNTVDTAGRIRDFRLPFGYTARYDVAVEIPAGYSLKDMPRPMEIDNDWHHASISYRLDGAMLYCEVEIDTRDTTTPLDRIPERNEAVRAFRRLADTKLVLTKD